MTTTVCLQFNIKTINDKIDSSNSLKSFTHTLVYYESRKWPTSIYIISHTEFNTCELFVYLQNCVLECVMHLERNETVYRQRLP
jgi:hypothetical protein